MGVLVNSDKSKLHIVGIQLNSLIQWLYDDYSYNSKDKRDACMT